MVHFTMFGGSDVRLGEDRKVIITMFGSTDVCKATLAKRLLYEKQRLEQHKEQQSTPRSILERVFGRESTPSRHRNHIALTLFGGTDIIAPPLVDEFLDMRELVSRKLILPEEWNALLVRLDQEEGSDGISTFTLFGGLGESSRSDAEEIQKNQSARQLGLINNDEERSLQAIVGKDARQIRTLIRQIATDQ